MAATVAGDVTLSPSRAMVAAARARVAAAAAGDSGGNGSASAPRYSGPPASTHPPTAYAAKFSMPFGIALGLSRGRATLADFTDELLADPELRRLASLVSYELDPDNPYPDAFTGHVRLAFADGRIEEATQDFMRDGAHAPLTRAVIDDKFRANVRFGNHPDAERLLAVCDMIGRMKGDHRLVAELAG